MTKQKSARLWRSSLVFCSAAGVASCVTQVTGASFGPVHFRTAPEQEHHLVLQKAGSAL